MNEYHIAAVAGLDLKAKPSAIVGSLLLWILVSGLAAVWLDLSLGEAAVGGLAAVALHWASDLIHHLGHAWAARRTGYPMIGVQLWGFLGTSIYPIDEPSLPARIHIRRALGGPAASLLLALLALAIARLLGPVDETPGWVAAFFFMENLLLFGLGAFLPLGFTDGSTLLEWWGKRQNE